MTANGSMNATEEAMVFVNEMDMFVTVQLLKDTPAALSLGKFCEENVIHMNGKKVKTQILSKITRWYLANAKTSCSSVSLVSQVKHTLRVQQKIQLKPPRSRNWMITKRRKHREIDGRICENGCRKFMENLVEPRSTSSGRDSKDSLEPRAHRCPWFLK